MAAFKAIKRNIAEVGFGPNDDRWTEDPPDSGRYVSNTATARVTITFLDSRPPQVHDNCPVGSKVRESAAGGIHVNIL